MVRRLSTKWNIELRKYFIYFAWAGSSKSCRLLTVKKPVNLNLYNTIILTLSAALKAPGWRILRGAGRVSWPNRIVIWIKSIVTNVTRNRLLLGFRIATFFATGRFTGFVWNRRNFKIVTIVLVFVEFKSRTSFVFLDLVIGRVFRSPWRGCVARGVEIS